MGLQKKTKNQKPFIRAEENQEMRTEGEHWKCTLTTHCLLSNFVEV